jgi:hypothetical protein
LGGAFTVESTEPSLLKLTVDAFGGLPRHRLAPRPQRFRVRLVATEHRSTWSRGTQPPRPVFTAGAGLLCATIDAGNFAVVDVAMSRALVGISRGLLRYPYHARYELIELALMTLASRAQSLVPLHAACVGAHGLGLLLMGPSGAGKSTLSLHAVIGGMQLLSEDSAFVAADSLRVTGVPNYLHVQPSALGFLTSRPLLRQIRRSPVIRRRSGARKYEVDLRKMPGQIARTPLRLAATVFLSHEMTGRQPPLKQLGGKTFLSRLRSEQPYASGLSTWEKFERHVVGIPAYEMRREEHPDMAVRQLRALLAATRMQA